MNTKPQLEDLRLFCVVVRNRSFAETARELGVSKAVVSKRISLLEAAVEERLFHRTTRNVSLTAQGEIVQQWAQRILEDVDLMGEAISREKAAPSGLLRICSSTGFGRSRLAPALSALARQYPQLEIQLELFDRPVDLVDEGFDLAIRLTRVPPELLVAKPLMSIDYVLCASPKYIKSQPISVPSDLASLNCLSYGLQGLSNEWVFQKGKAKEVVKVSGNVVVNSSEIVRDLILEGTGVGLVARYAVSKELSSGKLHELLPAWKPAGSFTQTAYAVWKQQTHLPQKTRVFIDFLHSRLAQSGMSKANSA